MNSFSGMNSGSPKNSVGSQRNAFMNPLHAYNSFKNDSKSSKESKEAPQTKNKEEKLIEQEDVSLRGCIKRHSNDEAGDPTLKGRESELVAHKHQDHSLDKENQIEEGGTPDSFLASDQQQRICKQKAEKGSSEYFKVFGIQGSDENNELKDYIPGHTGAYPLVEITPHPNFYEERKQNGRAPLCQKKELNRMNQEKISVKPVTEADIPNFKQKSEGQPPYNVILHSNNSAEVGKRKESLQAIKKFEDDINEIQSFHSSKRLSLERILPAQYREESKHDQGLIQQNYRDDSDGIKIKFIDTEQDSNDLQGFSDPGFHSFHNTDLFMAQPKDPSSQGNAKIIKTKNESNHPDEVSPEKVSKTDIEEVDWDDFIELEKLGEGTYGEVWRYFSKTYRKFFALKKAKKVEASTKHEYEILERLRKLNNKKLLQIIKLEYVPGEKFIAAMEYGYGTLEKFAEFLKNENFMWPDEDLVNLYYQLEDQVRELKNIRLCHRDIKPANVIISNEGKFKLTDFGLAEEVPNDGEQWMKTSGTEKFCAPQLRAAMERRDAQCWIDPFEADMISIEKTIDYIMQKNDWTNKLPIRELIKNYPRPKILKNLNLHTTLQGKFSWSILDNLYKERELPKKYDMMRVFTDYYKIDEVAEWLKRKFKEPKKEEENIQFYFLIGEIFRRNGRYTQAEHFYKKIYQIKPEPETKIATLIADALESMEKEGPFPMIPGMEKYMHTTKLSAHIVHITKLTTKTLNFGENSLQVAEEYRSFGQKNFCSGYRTEALELFEKACAIVNKINPNAVSQLHHQFALARGEYHRAICLHQKYIQALKKEYGKDHPTIGFELMKLGRNYNIIKQTSNARKCYQEALQTLRETFSDDHIVIGKLYQDIGDSYLFEDMSKAKHFYKLNLEICYKINSTENDIVEREGEYTEISSVILNSPIDFFNQMYLINCLTGPENIQAEDNYLIKDLWKDSGLEFGETSRLRISNKTTYFGKLKSLTLKHPNFIISLLEIGCIYEMQKRFIELDELNRIVSNLNLYNTLHNNICSEFVFYS